MSRTEYEKMLAGALYTAADAELSELRLRARRLVRRFNASDDADLAEREGILRELFGRVGARPFVEPTLRVDYGRHVEIGDDVFMNFDCVLLDVCPIRIGSRVQVGTRVQMVTALHPLGAIERAAGPEYARPIGVGDDVWLGAGVIVCPGVTIGSGTTVGAGSVVTRDVPAGVLAAGSPCRVLRELAPDERSGQR